jgi:GT2 family glycosyltransferase
VAIIPNPWAKDRWSIKMDNESSLPKITIGILSYNRREDLRRTLEALTLTTQYPDYEVIVVDNNSADGSAAMVSKEFPNVKLIQLEKNIGTSGRNYFHREAAGKYVFSFDDDSFAATPSTIYEVVSFLEQNTDVDALTMYYYQPHAGYLETEELPYFRFSGNAESGFEGIFFAEGGMCFKASSFLKTNGYDSEFLVYGEGLDITLQMYKLGMKLLYHPGFATLHMKSIGNRHNLSPIQLITRNHLWTLGKHFPLYALIPMVIIFILRQIIASILHPWRIKAYVKGIKSGIYGIPSQREKCKKFSFKQLLGLKRWYLFFYRW